MFVTGATYDFDKTLVGFKVTLCRVRESVPSITSYKNNEEMQSEFGWSRLRELDHKATSRQLCIITTKNCQEKQV